MPTIYLQTVSDSPAFFREDAENSRLFDQCPLLVYLPSSAVGRWLVIRFPMTLRTLLPALDSAITFPKQLGIHPFN